jgi:hypothetical protein
MNFDPELSDTEDDVLRVFMQSGDFETTVRGTRRPREVFLATHG